MIHSALARPYTGYYPRIEQKAAALVESMVNNHGFADGNKRTTIILTYTLLKRSGFWLRSAEKKDTVNEELETMIIAAASGNMNYAEILDWFRERISKSSAI